MPICPDREVPIGTMEESIPILLQACAAILIELLQLLSSGYMWLMLTMYKLFIGDLQYGTMLENLTPHAVAAMSERNTKAFLTCDSLNRGLILFIAPIIWDIISFFDAVGYVYSRENNYKFVTGDKEFEKLPNVQFMKK